MPRQNSAQYKNINKKDYENFFGTNNNNKNFNIFKNKGIKNKLGEENMFSYFTNLKSKNKLDNTNIPDNKSNNIINDNKSPQKSHHIHNMK